MKNLFILVALVLLCACDKAKDCPEVLKGKSQSYLLTNEETATVKSLFESNNLKFDNLQCYRLVNDFIYAVTCHQYVNNLRIFSSDVQFVFDKNRKFSFLSGDTISQINTNSNPSMNVSELRTIFLQKINSDTELDFGKGDIAKDCLVCELGYYDMNTGTNNLNPDFELAWLVKPSGSNDPHAIISDSQKSLVTYFNGIYY